VNVSGIERRLDGLNMVRAPTSARIRFFRPEAKGRAHRTIELAREILMQGQRINKGQSGAMA
jgi:hypothetical protein